MLVRPGALRPGCTSPHSVQRVKCAACSPLKANPLRTLVASFNAAAAPRWRSRRRRQAVRRTSSLLVIGGMPRVPLWRDVFELQGSQFPCTPAQWGCKGLAAPGARRPLKGQVPNRRREWSRALAPLSSLWRAVGDARLVVCRNVGPLRRSFALCAAVWK